MSYLPALSRCKLQIKELRLAQGGSLSYTHLSFLSDQSNANLISPPFALPSYST